MHLAFGLLVIRGDFVVLTFFINCILYLCTNLSCLRGQLRYRNHHYHHLHEIWFNVQTHLGAQLQRAWLIFEGCCLYGGSNNKNSRRWLQKSPYHSRGHIWWTQEQIIYLKASLLCSSHRFQKHHADLQLIHTASQVQHRCQGQNLERSQEPQPTDTCHFCSGMQWSNLCAGIWELHCPNWSTQAANSEQTAPDIPHPAWYILLESLGRKNHEIDLIFLKKNNTTPLFLQFPQSCWKVVGKNVSIKREREKETAN